MKRMSSELSQASSADDRVRIVVADDQPLMRRAIADLVHDEPCLELVGEAANGEEAVQQAQSAQADLVLMDLDMPVMSGVDAIAALTDQTNIRAMALTTFSSMDWVLAALRAGASGYLVKDSAPDMIVQAVQQVMEDTMALSPSVVSLLSRQVLEMPERAVRTHDGEAPQLTEREQQVLDLLAGGLSNREIAQELFLSEGSVKLHMGKACDKLGARDRVQLLVRAVELGLVRPALLKPETAGDRYR